MRFSTPPIRPNHTVGLQNKWNFHQTQEFQSTRLCAGIVTYEIFDRLKIHLNIITYFECSFSHNFVGFSFCRFISNKRYSFSYYAAAHMV